MRDTLAPAYIHRASSWTRMANALDPMFAHVDSSADAHHIQPSNYTKHSDRHITECGRATKYRGRATKDGGRGTKEICQHIPNTFWSFELRNPKTFRFISTDIFNDSNIVWSFEVENLKPKNLQHCRMWYFQNPKYCFGNSMFWTSKFKNSKTASAI